MDGIENGNEPGVFRPHDAQKRIRLIVERFRQRTDPFLKIPADREAFPAAVEHPADRGGRTAGLFGNAFQNTGVRIRSSHGRVPFS